MKAIARGQKLFLQSRDFMLLCKYEMAGQQKPSTRENERRHRRLSICSHICFLVCRLGGSYRYVYSYKVQRKSGKLMQVRSHRLIEGLHPAALPSLQRIEVCPYLITTLPPCLLISCCNRRKAKRCWRSATCGSWTRTTTRRARDGSHIWTSRFVSLHER